MISILALAHRSSSLSASRDLASRGGKGERDVKDCSFSLLAFDPNRSPVMLDNLRDNIQAHPQSRKGTLLERDRPVEAFKNPPV
jgi:hypothetical protein